MYMNQIVEGTRTATGSIPARLFPNLGDVQGAADPYKEDWESIQGLYSRTQDLWMIDDAIYNEVIARGCPARDRPKHPVHMAKTRRANADFNKGFFAENCK